MNGLIIRYREGEAIKRELYSDTRQLARLAGLMEGEGSFARGSPAKPRRPTTSIHTTDEDIISRVCELWGTRLWALTRYKPAYRARRATSLSTTWPALVAPPAL